MSWNKDIPIREYEVMILPFAQEDIEAQADYIAFELEAPETALKLVNGFKKIINNLSIFPQRHELDEDPELKKYGIRKTFYKNYKIYFWINENEKVVYIIRVFHMLVDSRKKILAFVHRRFHFL